MTQRIKRILLLLGDLTLLYLSLLITTLIYKDGQYFHSFFLDHARAFTWVFPFWILNYYIEGIYSINTFNKDGLIVTLIRAQIVNIAFALFVIYLIPIEGLAPKTNIFILMDVSGILIYIYRKIFYAIFSARNMSMNTVAIGAPEHIQEIEKHLGLKPYLGFNIIKTGLNDISEIPPETQLIAIDRTQFGDKKLLNAVTNKMKDGVQLVEMTRFTEIVTGKIPVSAIDESWFIENCSDINNQSFLVAKNLMDKFLASLIFICILPIYLVLIPLLLLISGRPIFYSQIRTGLNNKEFKIYKLRTMSIDAEKNGAKWAQPKDSRVTPVGKFLRKTRLDELPQLWNILNGDMSLVGPRPERPEIIKEKLETTIPYYTFRHLVKPGVTGWAQVNFRYGYSEADSMEKLQYDLYYVKNKSNWLDVKIILKTIKTVLTAVGQ